MNSFRLPRALCAAIADILNGSHPTLDALFEAAGAPGPPPELPHSTKWKTWLYRAGNDPDVDSLALVGSLIEEFMDIPPAPSAGTVQELLGGLSAEESYQQKRSRLVTALEENGLRYFRGGRVIPTGSESRVESNLGLPNVAYSPQRPNSVDELLATIIRGLPRAMHPLAHRRKGAVALRFENEYDLQDLLHSQLRPWIADIRPEEFTPSYGGSSTRMDFLLPRHELVIEVKRVRDRAHGQRIGDELIIDIEHYRQHPQCRRLWCVIFDSLHLLVNPAGLIDDISGTRDREGKSVEVRVLIVSA